jgi:hypothetical protein
MKEDSLALLSLAKLCVSPSVGFSSLAADNSGQVFQTDSMIDEPYGEESPNNPTFS